MVPALPWCTRLIARRVRTLWKRVRYIAWFCGRARRPGRSPSSKARTKLSHQRQSQTKKRPLKLSRLQLKKASPSLSLKKKTPSSRKRNGQNHRPRDKLIHFRCPIDQTFQLKIFIRRAVTVIGRQFSQRAAN